MNITVSILGRSTIDQDFTQLVAPAVIVLTGDDLPWTPPALPPGADGQELRLRLQPDEGLSVTAGVFLDPATRPAPTPIHDDQGNVVGEETGPTPMALNEYGIWARAIRDLPMKPRTTFIFRRNGTPLTIS